MRASLRPRWLVLAALSAAALVPMAIASCAATGSTTTVSQGAAGSGGAGGEGGGTGATGGTLFLDASDDVSPDAPCGAISQEADKRTLNLYILVDKSSSMAGPKWQAARDGLAAYLESPAAAGTKVALKFFPREADATPACDQNAYKEPDVDYVTLPAGAAAVLAAVDAEVADGFSSPLYPALGGAILQSIDVVSNLPDERAAVLVVTDGQPQGPAATCSGVDPEDPAVIAGLAAAGVAFDPSILTFVIGLPGVDQTSANVIAQGGGTDEAILVSNVNVATEFANALAKASGEALPCEYALPPELADGTFDMNQVNVTIGTGGQEPAILPKNQLCVAPGLGWRYDDPVTPTAIELCEASCDALKSDLTATIFIALGCPTVVTN